VKYCKNLPSKDAPQSAQRPASKKAEEKPQGKNTNKNTFLCLQSDSEDDEVVIKPSTKDQFPALAVSKLTHTASVSTNYAAALAKPPAPAPKPVSVLPAPLEIKAAPWASGTAGIQAIPLPPFRRPMSNWADDSDSEDDEYLISSPSRVVSAPAPVDDNSAW